MPACVPFTGGGFFSSGFSGGTHDFTLLNGGTNFPAGCTVYAFVAVDHGDIAPLASPPVIGAVGGVGGSPMVLAEGNLGAAGSSSMVLYYFDCPSSTIDTITIGNGIQYSFFGVIGGYLTGVATGGPGLVVSEQQFGQQDSGHGNSFLSLTPPSGGIGVWGFFANGGALAGAVPIWSNVAGSSSDVYFPIAAAELACNHALGTGASITAVVAPTGGGADYNFNTGMIAGGWAAGAAPPVAVSSWILGLASSEW